MPYSLTPQGQIYFTDACTSIRMYLCGSRIEHPGKEHCTPTVKAYYDSDKALALTMWDWYTSVCDLVTITSSDPCIPRDLVIGSKGWQGYPPYHASIGTKRIAAYNPLYTSKWGIYWEAIDDDGNEYTTDVAVTPESLAAAIKPILKPQCPQEWAFKVGTLCNPNTPAPNWNALLTAHRGYLWIGNECCSLHRTSSWTTTKDLDAYYKLGTICKWGTPYSQVQCTGNKLQVVGPDCTSIVNDKEADHSQVPTTIVKGHGIKIKVTGSKPHKPLSKWNEDAPTFLLHLDTCNRDNNVDSQAQRVLYLLQDTGYISTCINSRHYKLLLTDKGLCYYNLCDAGRDFVPPPRLLMAYTSLSNQDV